MIMPALDVKDFEWAVQWIGHTGDGCPVEPNRYCKVMYSNGFISQYVRTAQAWAHFTGGRDWWINPGDGRLYIVAYVVLT